jgi:hypothetical protein
MKTFIKIECIECKLKINHNLINRHLKVKHGYIGEKNNASREYYDKYIRKDEKEGKCVVYEKPTKFLSVLIGYYKHCSADCGNHDPQTAKQREQTFHQRYGVKYVSLLEKTIGTNKEKNKNRTEEEWKEISQKSRKTREEKYGDGDYTLIGHSSYIKALENKYGDPCYMFPTSKSFKKMIQDKIDSGNKDPFNRKQAYISTLITLKKRYGVNNVVEIPGCLEKIRNTNLSRYGSIIHYNGRNSKSSKKLFEELSKFFVLEYADHPKEHFLIVNNKLYFLDCLLKEKKKIIEYFGDFWHANPTKYKENDIIKFPGSKVIAKDIWNQDDIRLSNIRSLGK